MTDYKLKAMLEQWQKRLRMQDWDIQISHKRWREMQGDSGTVPWGRAMFNRQHADAEIEILHPDDYEQCTDPNHCKRTHGGDDIEVTVVHELLHIKFPGIQERDGKRCTDDEELAINQVANALVEGWGRHE